MGLDLFDTIQPNTRGMDAENLRSAFGGRISFYGGLYTQRLLAYGSAGEVDDEVLRLIRVAIGPLKLGKLEKGSTRPLSKAERDAVQRAMDQKKAAARDRNKR